MTQFRLLPLFLILISAMPASTASHEQIATLIKGRHWAAAQPLLEQEIAAEPANSEAHYFLGQVLLNLDRTEPAIAELEKAAELARTNPEYQCLLGDAYGTMAQKAGLFSKPGWAKKCKAAYEQAVSADPNSLHAHQSLMQYCMQAPGFLGGGMDHAYAHAAEIKRIDAAQGRIAYGMLYLQEKKYTEAFALFEEVLRTSPDDYMSLYQVGRIAAMSGQHLDRGTEVLQHCLTLPVPTGAPGRAPTHWRLGQIMELRGDKPAARAAYETAVQADARFAPAQASLKKLN